jgi:hypothetical protein
MKKNAAKAVKKKRLPVTAEESNGLFRKVIDACDSTYGRSGSVIALLDTETAILRLGVSELFTNF